MILNGKHLKNQNAFQFLKFNELFHWFEYTHKAQQNSTQVQGHKDTMKPPQNIRIDSDMNNQPYKLMENIYSFICTMQKKSFLFRSQKFSIWNKFSQIPTKTWTLAIGQTKHNIRISKSKFIMVKLRYYQLSGTKTDWKIYWIIIQFFDIFWRSFFLIFFFFFFIFIIQTEPLTFNVEHWALIIIIYLFIVAQTLPEIPNSGRSIWNSIISWIVLLFFCTFV